MSLSARGIARQFLQRSGQLSARQVFFQSPGSGSLRDRLGAIARCEIRFDVTECIYGITARYEQTWSHIRVRVQLVPDDGIRAATMTMLQAAWKGAIETRWSNRLGIGRAGEVTCPIAFAVDWVTDSPHHVVRVQVGPAPTNAGLWDTADSGAVAAHEFGHFLGNMDEYVDDACPDREPVGTGTVMDDNSNVVPPPAAPRGQRRLGHRLIAPRVSFRQAASSSARQWTTFASARC